MIYLFLAEGFEEVEALSPLDVLRRAGVEIKTVGIGGKTVKGSHHIPFICDLGESDVKLDANLRGIILPGGMPGTINLENNQTVQTAIDYCYEKDLLIAAICAAPSILGHKGIINKDSKAVCFPGFEDSLGGALISDSFVCEDGNIITAKGMGSAIEFGLCIAARFQTTEENEALRASLQIYNG
ncbi:MAG: DJ-1/PfpI family protein [Clostridiales bacterium]|nr:DJ-1/PfpI family protein [Clostridiales bacterium]